MEMNKKSGNFMFFEIFHSEDKNVEKEAKQKALKGNLKKCLFSLLSANCSLICCPKFIVSQTRGF
jgi:hypothetical protein